MTSNEQVLDALAVDQDGFWMPLWIIDACEGDMNAARMLARLLFWFKKGKDGEPRAKVIRDGKRWVAKRHDDWWDEARLGEFQAKRAAGKLTALGLVVMDHFNFGGMRTAHYRLNADEIARAVGANMLPPVSAEVNRPVSAKVRQPLTGDTTQGTTDSAFSGRDANDAPAEVAPLAPADIPAGGPTPAKVCKPRAPKAPDPLAVLAENIMFDTTGRMSAPDRRHAGLVWPLVGDIRAMVGDNPPAAVQVWMAFCDAQRDSGQWQYVQAHNARDRFGRWAANGGGPAIEQARAMFGAAAGEGGES